MKLSESKIVSIIPARGGSKGHPGKNIKIINGKPLIAHTIEYSLSCKFINRTFVSTDDGQIKNISSSYGAEIEDIMDMTIKYYNQEEVLAYKISECVKFRKSDDFGHGLGIMKTEINRFKKELV